MARPNESAHRHAAATFLHRARLLKSSADALLHPVASLRRTASRARWCSDSASASDQAAFETQRIGLSITDRLVSAARSAESQPSESPSTKPRRSDADRCVLPAAPASTNHRGRKFSAY